MRRLYFLFLAFIFVGATATDAFSKNPKRRISGEEMKESMFSVDRTYWAYKQIDRYYFKTDGTFLHQINEPKGNIPIGTVLNAKYYVQGDLLCWEYSQADIQTFGFKGDPLCFSLYTRETKDEFMVDHHPIIRLKAPGAGPDDEPIIFFYSWHFDDFIFDPKFVPAVLNGMKTMEKYRKDHNGIIPDGTINREELRSYMKEYYDMAIGKILYINRDYMYYLKNGDAYWITEELISKAKGDVKKAAEYASKGSWSIKGNIHCWSFPKDGTSSCEFVFPRGIGLRDREFKHFLGTHHTGMTRIHNEEGSLVQHLTVENSYHPKVFEYLRQLSGSEK
jgi:hypothetical protein